MIRRFLSYLPSNVWEVPPRIEPADDRNRRDEELLSIIPREKRKPYDAHAVLSHVVDRDSFFEMGPLYGRARIIGLARVNGYPVGVMINNPKFQGGTMDLAAGLKVVRFLNLCDTFHLPLVYLADEPGFMVGLEAQKQGIVRAGARLVHVTGRTRMPWITIVIRQLYGVAGQLNLRPSGMYRRYAWPSGNWGSMHIQGGTYAAYRREIDSAPDPEAKLAEIEARLQRLASPFRTAETFSIEDIIDPRETRPVLADFVEMAQGVLKTQLGPTMVPAYEPWVNRWGSCPLKLSKAAGPSLCVILGREFERAELVSVVENLFQHVQGLLWKSIQWVVTANYRQCVIIGGQIQVTNQEPDILLIMEFFAKAH